MFSLSAELSKKESKQLNDFSSAKLGLDIVGPKYDSPKVSIQLVKW